MTPKKTPEEKEAGRVARAEAKAGEGVPVGSLDLGTHFKFGFEGDNLYRLTGKNKKTATVHLLEEYDVEFAPGEHRVDLRAAAQQEMPAGTLVQPQ